MKKSDDYYSAAELSQLPPFNGVRRTVLRRADRESWVSRRRIGKGGGYEYHISSLPAETQRVLKARQGRQTPSEQETSAVNDAELAGSLNQQHQADQTHHKNIGKLINYTEFSARELAQIKARSDVLAAMESYIEDFNSLAESTSQRQAIHHFATDYNRGRVMLGERVKHYVPKLSRTTVLRWRAAYIKEGPAGLLNDYKSVKRSVIDQHPEVLAFAEGMVGKMPHIRPKNLWLALDAHFDGHKAVSIPTERAVRRWLTDWKHRNQRLFTAVANPDAFKNQYLAAGGDAGEGIDRLNQLWEMDSSPADVMCTDGRFSLIACLDVYSRRAVLKVRKNSDSWGVALTLREAILQWGIDGQADQVIRVDNGKDYASHYMAMVCDVLGLQLKFTAPFSGEQKPFVERFFRTFAHGIVELLPGYIGHNVADRKAIEAQFSYADRLKRAKGSSKNVIDVSLSSEQLQELCDRWLAAYYMHTGHSGLCGETPAQRVDRWVEPVRRIDNVRALDLLLQPIPGNKGRRTVQKKGIKLDGGWYVAPELGALVGDQLMVRYDSSDIGNLYLFDESGAFVCIAQNPAITGISREELARGMKEQQKALGEEKAQLRAKARKIDQMDVVDQILAKRERELAEQNQNVTRLPRRSHDHSTDYLDGAEDALKVSDVATKAAEPVDGFNDQGEPGPEMQRAWSDYVKERKGAEQTSKNPKTEGPMERFQRWIALDDRVKAGETLSEFEQEWKTRQEATPEWQGHKLVYDAFGKIAFGLKG